MSDDRQDMRTPEGWAVRVKEGRYGDTTPAEFAPLAGGAAWVPAEFSMIVRDDEQRLAVLRFKLVDGYPTLVEALASTELTTVLAAITRARSIDWWKRKAIHDLTDTSLATFDAEILDRVAARQGATGEDLETIAAALQQTREGAWKSPMRRPRRRVTEDRLDDIAARYVAAEARGSRTPTRDVWEEINAGKTRNQVLSKDRVRHLVSEARAKGKLPPATSGPGAKRGDA